MCGRPTKGGRTRTAAVLRGRAGRGKRGAKRWRGWEARGERGRRRERAQGGAPPAGWPTIRRPTARAGRAEQANERQRPNEAEGGGARTGGRGKRPRMHPAETIGFRSGGRGRGRGRRTRRRTQGARLRTRGRAGRGRSTRGRSPCRVAAPRGAPPAESVAVDTPGSVAHNLQS